MSPESPLRCRGQMRKLLGERLYCGDDDMDEDNAETFENSGGFVFVAYASFEDIVTEREEAKRTKEEDVIADVHALSAGGVLLLLSVCGRLGACS